MLHDDAFEWATANPYMLLMRPHVASEVTGVAIEQALGSLLGTAQASVKVARYAAID